MFDFIQPLDNTILFAIQSWHNPVLDFIMPIISFISDNGFIWIPVIVLMIIFRKTRKIGICMAIAFVVCAGGAYLLKHVIDRPRPCDLFPEVSLLVDRPEANTSFPSGHTILSFAPAICLWFRTWKFGLPATVFACLVAFSRLYLFCHNPSDIAASILIAAAVSLLTIMICYLIFPNRKRSGPDKKKTAVQADAGSGRHYR